MPETAELLGVTRLTVHRWLRGTRRGPDGLRPDQVIRDTRTQQAYIPEAIARHLRSQLRSAESRLARKRSRLDPKAH